MILYRHIGNSCDWAYAGGTDVDAICIMSNKDIQLKGVGVFDCDGTITVKCKVYKGDNDCNLMRNHLFGMRQVKNQ